jgi:NTP pyrophosphatase (non-canonical NTP hydrolase)
MARPDVSVDTGSLRDLGNRVSKLSTDYKTEVTKIYNIVDELNQGWDDNSNKAYVAKVREYKDLFDELGEVINNYGIFMIKAAAKYERAIEDITSSTSNI